MRHISTLCTCYITVLQTTPPKWYWIIKLTITATILLVACLGKTLPSVLWTSSHSFSSTENSGCVGIFCTPWSPYFCEVLPLCSCNYWYTLQQFLSPFQLLLFNSYSEAYSRSSCMTSYDLEYPHKKKTLVAVFHRQKEYFILYLIVKDISTGSTHAYSSI